MEIHDGVCIGSALYRYQEWIGGVENVAHASLWVPAGAVALGCRRVEVRVNAKEDCIQRMRELDIPRPHSRS